MAARLRIIVVVLAGALTMLGSLGAGSGRANASADRSRSQARWSVGIHASALSVRVGTVVTFGVSAAPAAFTHGHRVYLKDLTTGGIMRVCSRSTGLTASTCIAQDQRTTPGVRRYRALIVLARKSGLRVLARSSILTVTWHRAPGWSVSLTADGKSAETVATGSQVTLRAVSSHALGGGYQLEIRAQGCIAGSRTCIRGGVLITTCYSGTTCATTVSAPAQGGTVERYRATVLGPVSSGTGALARSRWVKVTW